MFNSAGVTCSLIMARAHTTRKEELLSITCAVLSGVFPPSFCITLPCAFRFLRRVFRTVEEVYAHLSSSIPVLQPGSLRPGQRQLKNFTISNRFIHVTPEREVKDIFTRAFIDYVPACASSPLHAGTLTKKSSVFCVYFNDFPRLTTRDVDSSQTRVIGPYEKDSLMTLVDVPWTGRWRLLTCGCGFCQGQGGQCTSHGDTELRRRAPALCVDFRVICKPTKSLATPRVERLLGAQGYSTPDQLETTLTNVSTQVLVEFPGLWTNSASGRAATFKFVKGIWSTASWVPLWARRVVKTCPHVHPDRVLTKLSEILDILGWKYSTYNDNMTFMRKLGLY